MKFLVAIHGRGATAASIRPLAEALTPAGFEVVAPQAPGGTWYPYSFMAPFEANQPHLDNSLAKLAAAHQQLTEKGVKDDDIYWMGFSQGACLMLEYCTRNARRYGGLAAFSGGLVGPEGTSWDYPGRFDGTPIYMGCSNPDPHIPKARFEETAILLKDTFGADVKANLFVNMGHTITETELRQAQEWLFSE
jgi:phospholipase/carboxylesterase